MEITIQDLVVEHREIEAALEVLAESVASGAIDSDAFRLVRRLCERHYGREEAFLVLLATRDVPLADKLRGQHAETLEIAARLEECETRDAIYLSRRLVAITQHNIIEEERDVFPFAGKT